MRCLKRGPMKFPLKLISGLALATGLTLALPAQRAEAYPVDCAILLCLSGGWPASAECAHARAVFIRRITPWPIEPPLQIWNCPMGTASNTQVPSPFMETLRRLAHEHHVESTDDYVSVVERPEQKPPAPFPALFSGTSDLTRDWISFSSGKSDITM